MFVEQRKATRPAKGFTICWTLGYKREKGEEREPFLENLLSNGKGDMQIRTKCCDRGSDRHEDRRECAGLRFPVSGRWMQVP